MNTWWRSKQKNETKKYIYLNKFARYFGLKTNPSWRRFVYCTDPGLHLGDPATLNGLSCGLVDYEQSLFFLSPSSNTPEIRKKWPRAWLKARDGRGEQSFFAQRSHVRALPLLNLKKKRDCSHSSGLADILYFEHYYVCLLLAGNSFYLIGYLFSL